MARETTKTNFAISYNLAVFMMTFGDGSRLASEHDERLVAKGLNNLIFLAQNNPTYLVRQGYHMAVEALAKNGQAGVLNHMLSRFEEDKLRKDHLYHEAENAREQAEENKTKLYGENNDVIRAPSLIEKTTTDIKQFFAETISDIDEYTFIDSLISVLRRGSYRDESLNQALRTMYKFSKVTNYSRKPF